MMSVQTTSRGVAFTSGDVAVVNRPREELAVALYMSAMPDRRLKGHTWTPVQLAAWVREGIAALEGDRHAWHAAYRSQKAAEAGDWMKYRLFWEDSRREKTARSAAAQITMSSGYTYRPSLAWVIIASCDYGHEWHMQLDARDVRFAAELGVVLR